MSKAKRGDKTTQRYREKKQRWRDEGKRVSTGEARSGRQAASGDYGGWGSAEALLKTLRATPQYVSRKEKRRIATEKAQKNSNHDRYDGEIIVIPV